MFSLLQRQNPFIAECYRFFSEHGDIRSRRSLSAARSHTTAEPRRRKKKRKSINKETIYIEAIDSFSSKPLVGPQHIDGRAHQQGLPRYARRATRKLKRKVSARCLCGAVLMCIPFCLVKFFIATFLPTRVTCWNVDLHFWLSSPSFDGGLLTMNPSFFSKLGREDARFRNASPASGSISKLWHCCITHTRVVCWNLIIPAKLRPYLVSLARQPNSFSVSLKLKIFTFGFDIFFSTSSIPKVSRALNCLLI